MSHHNHSAVVLEIGGWYTKCGFAESSTGAEDAPRLIVEKRLPRMMQMDLSGKMGQAAAPEGADAPEPKLIVPKSIAEWKPVVRQHLDDVLFSQLLCNPKDRRVVVVEDLLAPNNFRQALAECLFDLCVPSVLFAPGTLLAILATGARTGIVVDIGAEEVRVLPVYDGVPLLSAYTTSQLGSGPSQEMHNNILSTLDRQRKQSVSTAMLEDIIVRCCVVPPQHAAKVDQLQAELRTSRTKNSAELNAWIEKRQVQAQKLAELVPDSIIDCTISGVGTVSGVARAAPATVLFDGDEEGDTVPGLIVKALLACSSEIRKDLLGNIVLTGGHAMLPGLPGRMLNALEEEMKRMSSLSALRPAVRLSRPQFQPNTLCWVGGALIGCAKEQLAIHSVSLEQYTASKEMAKERSEAYLRDATHDEIEQYTREVGLEVMADTDIMKANLRDTMREPEAQLPDWTRMVPGSTMTPGWYFRKEDESAGREWKKHEWNEHDVPPGRSRTSLKGTWQRDLDGAAGSGWMRLPDSSAAVLEEALRNGERKVRLITRAAGTDTVPMTPEQASAHGGVEYDVDLCEMKATRIKMQRNLPTVEDDDIPPVKTREVRRMGVEFGPPLMGFMGMFGPSQPLPPRS